MHLVRQLLDIAELTWRDIARTEYPVFAATPVLKADEDSKQEHHWQFSTTDRSVMHTDIFKPDVVQRLFTEAVVPRYKKAYPIALDDEKLVRLLINDTLTYLHFHENFHPAVLPDSKDDEEQCDAAILAGIRAGQPGITDGDAIHKVGNVRNALWDIVIDNAFFLSSGQDSLERRIAEVLPVRRPEHPEIAQMPDGVVPIFDILEIQTAMEKKKKPDSLFYPITRIMYGMLFARDPELRKSLGDFFSSYVHSLIKTEELRLAITGALKEAMRAQNAAQQKLCRVNKPEYETAVDTWYDHCGEEASEQAHRMVVETLAKITVDKRTRYAAIQGFVTPLAKYISMARTEHRPGLHANEGNGVQQALVNVANALGPPQSNAVLSNVANNPGGAANAEQTKELSRLATDEYYKRNAQAIPIRSPRQEATKIDLGKRQRWVRDTTHFVRSEDLHTLPLDQIVKFQQDTGITSLFELSRHEWQYDIYVLEETTEWDYLIEHKGLELPSNVVFHVDSSGSMGTEQYVGTGQKYDQLMHVVYGLLKSLRGAADTMKKDIRVITVNFSDNTILCTQPEELRQFYDNPFSNAKQTLLGFQGGGTVYDANKLGKIQKMLAPGTAVHVWVSDGDLEAKSVQPT
ncbi:MAG TPA: hypothetical protein VJK52_00705, partial [Candidatus Nanoarchaeia archaeon]|nr:hypothetical protein [Candidatus Nanoarchaeia archaeon]